MSYSATSVLVFKILHYYALIIIVFLTIYNAVSCVNNESLISGNHSRTRRSSSYKRRIPRSIPIIDDFNFDTEMSPEINKLLKDIDADKALVDSAGPLSPYLSKTLSDEIAVEWTYHSNAIEGNTLSLIETRALLDGLILERKSFREIKEALNHKKAINYVDKLAKEKRDLTEMDIREIHSLILDEIRTSDAGKYRQVNVYIQGGVSLPPQHAQVPQHMSALMKWYSQARDLHPIKRAAILHARFEMIHPFVDGNGRTGRLIANLELMKLGYPPGIICFENRTRYYIGIQDACGKNDYKEITKVIAQSVLSTLKRYMYALNLHQKGR